MRLIVVTFTLFLFALLSACGTVSSSSTTVANTEAPPNITLSTPKPRKGPVNTDYGVAPGEEARAAIEDYMRRVLDEPYNAQYRYVNAPVKGSHGGWSDTPVAYGYVMCVWVNAQQSDGEFTGEQLNYFLIRNDEVVRASSNANWLCKPYMQ